jgi:hypothetical protein
MPVKKILAGLFDSSWIETASVDIENSLCLPSAGASCLFFWDLWIFEVQAEKRRLVCCDGAHDEHRAGIGKRITKAGLTTRKDCIGVRFVHQSLNLIALA